MRKLIIVAMLLIQLSTSSIYAENKDTKYIYRLNDSIGEMNLELEDRSKLSILKGVNEGYIIPTNNNAEDLKEGLIGLKETLEKEEIENSKLKEKNELLVEHIEETISLLEETISFNNDLMDKNVFTKIAKLLFEGDSKVELVNKNIDEINNIHEAINNL